MIVPRLAVLAGSVVTCAALFACGVGGSSETAAPSSDATAADSNSDSSAPDEGAGDVWTAEGMAADALRAPDGVSGAVDASDSASRTDADSVDGSDAAKSEDGAVEACVPLTYSQACSPQYSQEHMCGQMPDGCGGYYDCGSSGTCAPWPAGVPGAIPGQCINHFCNSCNQDTCVALNNNCGTLGGTSTLPLQCNGALAYADASALEAGTYGPASVTCAYPPNYLGFGNLVPGTCAPGERCIGDGTLANAHCSINCWSQDPGGCPPMADGGAYAWGIGPYDPDAGCASPYRLDSNAGIVVRDGGALGCVVAGAVPNWMLCCP